MAFCVDIMQQKSHPQWIYWAFLIGTALLVIIIDQISKAIIIANLELYENWIPIPALARVFEITHTRNTGAAFGMFKSASNIFLIVALIASGVILYYYRQIKGGAWLIRFSMGMQMGGAIGNALDRVTRGYVVDFIHVFYEPHFDYPVFNVADSCIVIGVMLLVFLLWREDRKEKKEAAKTPPLEENLLVPEEEQRI